MSDEKRVPETPPEGVSGGDLWALLTSMPRPHRVVDFPRKLPGTDLPIGKVAMWPLLAEEGMVAATAAERFAKERLKIAAKNNEENIGYTSVFHNQAALEVLCRACRKPDDLKVPMFPGPAELRRVCTEDEIAVLFALYLKVRAEVGPMISRMSEDEYEAWIERLAEAGDTFPLGLLSPEAHDHLTLYLARQCRSLRMGTSSVGSPQDGSLSDFPLVPDDASTVSDEFANNEDTGVQSE